MQRPCCNPPAPGNPGRLPGAGGLSCNKAFVMVVGTWRLSSLYSSDVVTVVENTRICLLSASHMTKDA